MRDGYEGGGEGNVGERCGWVGLGSLSDGVRGAGGRGCCGVDGMEEGGLLFGTGELVFRSEICYRRER